MLYRKILFNYTNGVLARQHNVFLYELLNNCILQTKPPPNKLLDRVSGIHIKRFYFDSIGFPTSTQPTARCDRTLTIDKNILQLCFKRIVRLRFYLIY